MTRPLGRLCGALSMALLASAAGGQAGGEEREDPRSLVRLDYQCSSQLGGRQVTLFANGTVRLRRAYREEEEMRLAELGPDELGRYIARLAKIDAVADPSGRGAESSVQGSWVETCSLRLDLPGRQVEEHRFSRLDTPALRVAQLIQLAEELAREVSPEEPRRGLPSTYRPRIGDVLRDGEGRRFRVVGWTADDRGAELDGLDSPVRILVALDGLRQSFVAVEERGRGPEAPRDPP